MDWFEIIIYTTSEGIESVSGRLYQLGITGIEIEDEKDFKDFLENNKQYWDYVDDELIKQKEGETRIKAYVTNNAAGGEMLAQIRSSMMELKEYDKEGIFGRLEISLGNISEEDWANNWKKYFHPMEIGERVMIKPEWEELSEKTDRIVFNVNPGMTFGTGSHYTTQLCIEQLEKYIKPDSTMLDLGCGSGILSIISLMLGAKSATAVDIDPNAVDIAYENAARNGVDKSSYTVLSGNLVTDEELIARLTADKYDVVAANIVADVIIGITPFAKKCMKDDGVFITSGIIEDRIEDVEEALRAEGFVIQSVSRRKDWAAIVCSL